MRYRFQVDVEFDEPLADAEQGRLAGVAMERLVEDFWGDVADVPHIPMKVSVSQPVPLES